MNNTQTQKHAILVILLYYPAAQINEAKAPAVTLKLQRICHILWYLKSWKKTKQTQKTNEQRMYLITTNPAY